MEQQRSRKPRLDLLGTHVDNFLFEKPGLQILAYLERTIMYSLPQEYFIPDVMFYYEEFLGTVISVSQIEEKLQLFWSHWHRKTDKPSEWKKIYHLGLKGLPGLKEEIREWVRERAISLNNAPEGTPRRLRSATMPPRAFRSPAKTPSKSLAGNPTSSGVRKGRKHGESLTHKKKRARMSMPVHARRTPSSPTSEQATSTIILRDRSQHHVDDLTKMKVELVSSNRSSPSEQLHRSTEQSRSSQTISEWRDVRDQEVQTTPELHDVKNEKAKIISELDTVKDQKAQLMLELDDLRSQKAEDTRYWKRLYQKTLKQKNSLKRRNKHMQAEHSVGQDEADSTNMKLRSENDHLQERLDSYQATFVFKEPFLDDIRAQNLRKSAEHVESALSKLRKMLQGHDGLFSIQTLDAVKRPAFLALLKRGLGLDISTDSAGNAIPTADMCRTKLRAVILNLVSAALCAWVFEVEVGALFQENNVAYPKLQNLLAAQNKKLADSFEFAAHKECIDEPYIRDRMIPRQARCLARQIFDCTMPLLESHRFLNEDYAAMIDEWTEANQQLTEIFKQALYAKVRLLLTTDTYKCTLFVPGTPFDSNSMEDRTDGITHSTESESNRVVDITISPGLVRYASKKEGFNYNRFLAGEAAPKEIKPEVLKKAVVLTR